MNENKHLEHLCRLVFCTFSVILTVELKMSPSFTYLNTLLAVLGIALLSRWTGWDGGRVGATLWGAACRFWMWWNIVRLVWMSILAACCQCDPERVIQICLTPASLPVQWAHTRAWVGCQED